MTSRICPARDAPQVGDGPPSRRAPPVDGVVVVDADSVAAPGLIAGLEAAMARGAEAVQGEYLVLDDGTNRGTALRQAAFLLFHRVRFAGRDALGMPCNLVGNGMLFRSSLLRRLPWNAFTGAEDLEYSVDLRLAGVRPTFAPEALVSGPASALGSAGATQRMRWEGGRVHVLRTRMPRLLAAVFLHGRWSLLDAMLDLAVPPLGLMAMVIVLGGGVSIAAGLTGAVALWSAIPWVAAAVLVVAYVVIGLRAARAPSSAYRALLCLPASSSPSSAPTGACSAAPAPTGGSGPSALRKPAAGPGRRPRSHQPPQHARAPAGRCVAGGRPGRSGRCRRPRGGRRPGAGGGGIRRVLPGVHGQPPVPGHSLAPAGGGPDPVRGGAATSPMAHQSSGCHVSSVTASPSV